MEKWKNGKMEKWKNGIPIRAPYGRWSDGG